MVWLICLLLFVGFIISICHFFTDEPISDSQFLNFAIGAIIMALGCFGLFMLSLDIAGRNDLFIFIVSVIYILGGLNIIRKGFIN